MSTERTADAVIIGAGVIGAAIAFELSKAGLATINIDRLPAAGYGPTSASCSIVRATYSTWDGVAMAYAGFSYWENWPDYLGVADELGYARYIRCGTVMLDDATGRPDKVERLFDEVGVPFEKWSSDDLTENAPYLDLGLYGPPKRPSDPDFWAPGSGTIEGALYTPGSGYVNDPQLATHNLQRAAEAHGARFLFNAEVVEIRQAHGRVSGVVLGDGGRIDAPVVVNVSGPHSARVNDLAGAGEGMKIHTRALRHEVHQVSAPASIVSRGEMAHVSDGDLGIYFRPEGDDRILVGSEDPECDTRVWVDDPDYYDREVSFDQWEAQVLRLARRIPDLKMENRPKGGVVSLYDVSDDWIPIYDCSDVAGFYMAVGTSGNQFKNAGVVGGLMAAVVQACEAGHDHDADPVKFQAEYSLLTLDAGFYSRLRSSNPESSYSVNG
jgi:sarcosine oxidase, subunit beta